MEHVQYWRPHDLPGVELLHEYGSRRACAYLFETYAFAAALEIHASARYRRRSYTLLNGAVHLGEPGELYATLHQFRSCTIQVLRVEPALMQQAAQSLGLARVPHFRASHVEDRACFAALCQLQHSLTQSDSLLTRQSLLHETLRLLLTRYAETSPPEARFDLPPTALERAREYLHTCWNQPIALGELALAVGYSPSHLVDSFRRRFGLPPHRYQIQLRLARAQQWLAQGLSIASVAREAGFADQAHLTRHFRHSLGLTPGAYRNNRKIVQAAGEQRR
jgi:AraC-like DNA-binding protein